VRPDRARVLATVRPPLMAAAVRSPLIGAAVAVADGAAGSAVDRAAGSVAVGMAVIAADSAVVAAEGAEDSAADEEAAGSVAAAAGAAVVAAVAVVVVVDTADRLINTSLNAATNAIGCSATAACNMPDVIQFSSTALIGGSAAGNRPAVVHDGIQYMAMLCASVHAYPPLPFRRQSDPISLTARSPSAALCTDVQ
jgi:hypothetical protein